jgi:acetate kinase
MQYAGIELDDGQNDKNAPVVSTAASLVQVRVIPTNEELMIAKTTTRLYNESGRGEPRG